MYVERTFTVARPIEAVFDYLLDFTHTEAWDPGTVSTTRVSGDGGPGTRYHNTSSFMGRTTELEYETITVERPRRLRFRGHNDSATATDDLRLTPAADGAATQIHYRADFEFGRLVSLVAPLVVRPKLEKLADETVEQLKRTLTLL
jgi:carbon monoxide dehydrogenase subunit G